jgi:hypothetical protein
MTAFAGLRSCLERPVLAGNCRLAKGQRSGQRVAQMVPIKRKPRSRDTARI